MDRGAWWATIHGVTKESDMTEQLTHTHTHTHTEGHKTRKIQRDRCVDIQTGRQIDNQIGERWIDRDGQSVRDSQM